MRVVVVPGEFDSHWHLAQYKPGPGKLAPDRVGQPGVEFAGLPFRLGPSHVLVMDEEFAEVGPLVDPGNAEQGNARRSRPDRLDEQRIGRVSRYAVLHPRRVA